ncbi:hypothetical protein MMUR_05440 [Mycolicibacterium murale]|uniref:Phage tail tape measure protein domain-containing protein n=1 Tax=Mycolicibacterium murale TaxID=182220 RepID=A0A7I9WGG3_9MYCO|nr:phage tail tape measure protein [Mycolicibacterium murale]MCV7182858.1 phage tail tape measure protein [Mycolicibacterium murale]GFG56408.1 hypothetical protein MMUR_05440 [Mycolicibacterium murale]
MPLVLSIQSELDERSASAAADRAQRIYSQASRDMSRSMSETLTRGAREGAQAVERMADDARDAYKRVGDATDELKAAERQLRQMREEGARGVEVQAERVRRARRAERDAIREATNALEEYERAAENAATAGTDAASGFLANMRGAAAGAASAGGEFAEGFSGGFAGSSALMRLGAAGGPIGLALAGVGALGFMSGKVLVDQMAAGIQSQATRDLFQARLGVDETTMSRYGQAAANSFTDMWGTSVQDNLRTMQFAIQGGMIDRGASGSEIEEATAQLQTLATVMEVDVQDAARAAGQLIRTGFALDGEHAADIIAAGFQNGLDISGDWLDTINEYSTQWRKLGFEASDALGLIQQGLQGGARDTDVVADSLKEFSIRAVDGSKTTAEGFSAIGFNADDMAQRILAGGDSARTAFGATLDAIKTLDDPIQQALTWQALFGTQWEDMGDAINSMDLSRAREEFGSTEGAIQGMTDELSEHVNQWDRLDRQIGVTFTRWKEWLADTDIGRFLTQGLPESLSDALEYMSMPDSGNRATVPGWTPETGAPMPAGGPLTIDTPTGVNPLLDEARRQLGLLPGQAAPALPPMPNMPGPTISAPPGTAPAPPPPPPGAPAPVPGQRTPILTDTQQEAFGGGGGSSLPPAPVLPIAYTPTAGMPSALASATTRLDEARHDAAEREARLNQLLQSNVADQSEIQKARNDLAKADQSELAAEQALIDAQNNLVEQQLRTGEQNVSALNRQADALGQIGAQIDQDFGVSKGLPGIAENLTKFLANLAFAPVYGALTAQREAAGFGQGEAGGGITGMLASSGAFGPQFMPVPNWARTTGSPGQSALMSNTVNPAGIDAALLANVPSGTYTQEARGDLTQGLADCSSAVEDLVNMLDGRPTGGASMSTHNAAQWLTERGFLPGMGGPGDMRVGFNSGHMQATLPGGTNFNWGSQSSAAAGGLDGSLGAYDPSFTSNYYRPTSASTGGPSVTAGPSYTPAPGSGGASIYSPENTNPALNDPSLTTMPTGGPGLNGAPSGIGGPRLGPVLPMSAGQSPPSETATGGRPWAADLPPSDGIGIGGGVIGMAGSMAGGMGGALGAAGSDMAMQLIGRGIGAAGQYMGNAVSGVLETVLPNGSALGDPSSSWAGRLLGAAAGVKPALPNTAGALGGEQNPNMAEAGKKPLTPAQAQAGAEAKAASGGKQSEVGKNGDTYDIKVTNNRAREDGTGRDIQNQLMAGNGAKRSTL